MQPYSVWLLCWPEGLGSWGILSPWFLPLSIGSVYRVILGVRCNQKSATQNIWGQSVGFLENVGWYGEAWACVLQTHTHTLYKGALDIPVFKHSFCPRLLECSPGPRSVSSIVLLPALFVHTLLPYSA